MRWQADQPNRDGKRPGIFSLTNRLGNEGILSDDDWAWWRAANEWFNVAYITPADSIYDPIKNPGAAAYFKVTATHLLDRVPGYLDLLSRYSIGYECIRTSDPGRIIHEDPDQIVAVPRSS